MQVRRPRLKGLTTVVPTAAWAQEDVFRAVFAKPFAGMAKAEAIFQRAAVEQRYFAINLPQFYGQPQTIESRSAAYLEAAHRLGLEACRKALEAANLRGSDIDFFVVASCTGFAMPDLDVLLGPDLGLGRTVSRLTIGETGSHAGLPAVARAMEHVLAYPRHRVLLLVVEVASCNAQLEPTGENVVSAAIFADGASAMVIEGAEVASDGLTLLAAGSSTYFETASEMTYQLSPGGLQFHLGRHVPNVLAAGIKESVTGFLREQGMTREDINHWVSHPGGRLILERIQEVMKFARGELASSWAVLAHFGNLAAATVFFVLAEAQRHKAFRPGERILMLGYGPGLAIEMLLLQA